MTHSHTAEPTLHSGLMKAGAALAGGGMMLAATGMSLIAVAVTRAATAWARERDISPTALAVDNLGHAKYATLAGVHAWREHAAAPNGHRTHA
ncbi:MAG: hypothetical protein HOV83_28335 [Catenulispora sp.]|nr:hypothetical protein [Catenulispora sp.]